MVIWPPKLTFSLHVSHALRAILIFDSKVVRLDSIDGVSVGPDHVGYETNHQEVGSIGCSVSSPWRKVTNRTQLDVTERKMNEQIQRERVKEAEERRRQAEEANYQQELLVDFTSCVLFLCLILKL